MGGITYAVIVRVDFSPSDMGALDVEPRMPSSQPVQQRQYMVACLNIQMLQLGNLKNMYL